LTWSNDLNLARRRAGSQVDVIGEQTFPDAARFSLNLDPHQGIDGSKILNRKEVANLDNKFI
jgi:uncharacterized protein YabN with tetrapyrrole methylase and pyrophosphatase domain